MDILCPKCHQPNRSSARYCQHCRFDVVLNNDSPGADDRRYFITRIIKAGGQGAVYEGVDQHGHIYAIKEMLENFTDPKERDEAQKRFNAEANLLQGLSHPRIPRVYSHFTDEGRHYLTMDLVKGEDLQDIIAREKTIPEAQVLVWAYQICDVLAYLHDNGLIYRDMKPSNVMIEPDGNVKLIDFGIAKLFKPHERGTQIGTPGYAPPEQYQGLATRASDIYALGATLHHLLTGRDPTEHPPFSFEPARNLNPNISRRTSDAIEKALIFQPEERYGSVAEFRAMLRPLVGTTTPPSLSQSSPYVTATMGGGVQQHVSPPPPQKPPSPPPQPASKPPPQPAAKPRRSWCGCVSGVLLLIVGVLLAVFILVDPLNMVPDGTMGIPALSPTATPSPVLAPTLAPSPALVPSLAPVNEQFTTDVEVLVDASATTETIRAAFIQAYKEQAQQTYGAGIAVNETMLFFIATGNPDSPNWDRVGEEGGKVRYRATMQAIVQR